MNPFTALKNLSPFHFIFFSLILLTLHFTSLCYSYLQLTSLHFTSLQFLSSCPFTKFLMASILSFLISSGPKKKQPRYACLSEAKAWHSHRTCTEVSSSSVPHFLTTGLLLSLITDKCLLKVLCPVSRQITALDCVQLKENKWALVARLGPEVNSWVCLCVLQGPHQNTKCWLSIQCFFNLPMFCQEIPKKGSGATKLWTETFLRACRGFHFLVTQHVQGPSTFPQCDR